MFVDIIEVFIL